MALEKRNGGSHRPDCLLSAAGIFSLVELKNQLIQQGRYTDCIDELIFKVIKSVGKFIVEHPVGSLEIAGVVIGGGIKVVSAIRGNGSGGAQKSTLATDSSSSNSPSIIEQVADIVEKASRAENDVSAHKQRYHTKDGVIWKDKAPYHRGGNSN